MQARAIKLLFSGSQEEGSQQHAATEMRSTDIKTSAATEFQQRGSNDGSAASLNATARKAPAHVLTTSSASSMDGNIIGFCGLTAPPPMPWVNPLFQHQSHEHWSMDCSDASALMQQPCGLKMAWNQTTPCVENAIPSTTTMRAATESAGDADLISHFRQPSLPRQDSGTSVNSFDAIFALPVDGNSEAEGQEPDMSLFGGMWPTEMEKLLMSSFSADSTVRQQHAPEDVCGAIQRESICIGVGKSLCSPAETDAIMDSSASDSELLEVCYVPYMNIPVP